MTDTTCEIEGCTSTRRTPGSAWCEKHYHRWYRHGDPGKLNRKPGREKFETSHGYIRVRVPGHPIAHPTDHYVYEHRAVLYDSIGGGSHPCYWCGMMVSWDRTFPGDHDALCVDHLDGDKTNNHLSNLAPSCHGCNSGRATTDRHALNRARRNAWRITP